MYVKKQIVKKVIDLFTKSPAYRDDRWGTIKSVLTSLREENPAFTEWTLVQYAFEVDRSFRYVQQHIPSLRGRTWLKRQAASGQISKEEYDRQMENLKYINSIVKKYYKGVFVQQPLFSI